MENLIIILCAVIYVLLAVLSYRPFKRFSENGYSNNVEIFHLIFTPIIWVMYLVIAIFVGFKEMSKK